MTIILKANKVNLFVSSVLFVSWYHSPNFLDTLRVSDVESALVTSLFVVLSVGSSTCGLESSLEVATTKGSQWYNGLQRCISSSGLYFVSCVGADTKMRESEVCSKPKYSHYLSALLCFIAHVCTLNTKQIEGINLYREETFVVVFC
jgi:hypothetical protein